ncbi:GH36-type glycosyl hydrolase domain-containing protein [Undibacterium sp. Ren11W]|uniref:GH36-type glycosyl hydrolase domain-containing protein n=1 Tax=Undibacterium sp. Ren11W TaxID=3413045 RepID=UPI003BF36713
MKPDNNSLRDIFVSLKNFLSAENAHDRQEIDALPLRAELFSALQMEQHGRILANTHKLSTGWVRDHLLSRLADNEAVIIDTCNQLTAAVKIGRQVTPGAEWLLDNFYLIEEQIRTAKRHLPKNYSKELPRLSSGNSAGRPRVYDIALETISHGDGRVDPEGLSSFVAAYQQITTLKLGELWAIPIMLRLALIENLRRVSARLANARVNRNLACSWAENMAETAEKDPNNLILLVADMARSNPPLDSSFVAELVRRLQGQSPALMLPLTWLSHRLAETGLTIEQLVQSESQQQAADQVSISNSIGSLRFLSSMDWREFVENMSLVEHILRKDPANVYDKMDFSTRDRYRHVIENIAKHSSLSEVEVADNAIRFASRSNGNNTTNQACNDRTSHVGYYLIGRGVRELERSAAFQLPLIKALKRIGAEAPLSIYLSSIVLLSLLATGAIASKAYFDGVNHYLLGLVALFSLLATSQLALALVNWLATLLTMPKLLPRMDFSTGIPADSSSLVVVPTLLFNKTNIDSLTEALEVRFLANRDANLHFCLLSDFADATTETLSTDAHLLHFAKNNIDELNTKYRSLDSPFDHFILLHRPRRWNAQEKSWMAYERKRGKLADLNAFLRGGAKDAFSLIVGNIDNIENIRYVITLDTDTELPRDAARKFVATMAHPLNRACYDEKLQRVCEGYGVLQPRVAVSLPGANASRYELLCGGEVGIDPYTRTVSDVYQDVFGEGSFIGKGIYEVDVFEHALNGRMPENRILSHDLLEGCYARAGLISDVQLHEQHPSSYAADVSRRHRWIRGDWQIASWLFPNVPGGRDANTGKITRCRNPLSSLSRWKLFDNLRRSVVPIALTALLLIGWTVLPSSWFWSASALAILLIPAFCSFIFHLLKRPEDVLLRQHLSGVMRATNQHSIQAALTLAFLPYEAWFNLDAIIRTQWRILFSRRRLLEWKPSSETNRQSVNGLRSYLKQMWVAPSLALATAIYLFSEKPMALTAAAPILLLWLASPFVAYWISRPIARRPAHLTEEQKIFLASLSRKTWLFFETYVTEKDNWLPPDNVQEYPVAAVARRTSPTNIGVSLLANLAAYDFAYITAGQMITRTKNTLQTMAKLERYQGHFYNWYDTQYLTPLHPIYVSAVDSGNLAGHLLTLRPGLIALTDAPIFGHRVFHGIRDTYEILLATNGNDLKKTLTLFNKDLTMACLLPPETLIVAHDLLLRLSHAASNFLASLEITSDPQRQVWASALAQQCLDALSELDTLAPWTSILTPAEWIHEFPGLANIPSLRQLAQLEFTMKTSFEKSEGARATEQHISQEQLEHIRGLRQMVADGSARANERLLLIEQLAQVCTESAQMDYGFLYDSTTHLLAIGYNVTERRRDVSCYDLLASEARLAAFVAIAQGQLPQESWFALGRQLTIAGGEPILLSWSGSMFEYLMPLLVMPTFDNTLLDQTYQSAVQRQITYGEQRGVPWGISESGYNAFDASLNYQYRAFGVPGLGFKRGLGDDLVIAPYASMMALMIAPEQACKNLQDLAALGFEGQFGFYEAIDYTQARLPRGQSNTVIRSFMTHHQGMGFLSLAYLLLDRPMQKRFVSDPLFQATIQLLHERVPKASASYSNTTELADIRTTANDQEMQFRVLQRPDPRTPEVQLLSNGRYHVMMTSAGGSYSRWYDTAITRWREDSTRDNWGSFCYVRDMENGHFWSTTYQPTLAQPSSYEVIFSEGRAEFRRSDNNFNMHTEVVVSPEDDIELRRTRITNRSRYRRTIEITSYAEVVLAPAAADAMHPAFSNLFVQTEIIEPQHAVLCTRRPRSHEEKTPWMFHLMAVHGGEINAVSYETDRMQFIGRGNTVAAPQAMLERGALSNSQGSVLDPIVAIRHLITLDPEESASFDIVTGIADSRAVCLELIEKYQDRHLADRVVELSWTHSQVMLRQLNASEADAQLYGRLANSVVFINPMLRAEPGILIRNQRGQSGLWSHAISGDLPIVLVQIKNQENIELVRQLVQAHAYWRSKGLAVDLAIWNEEHNGYRQELQEQIIGLISSVTGAHAINKPGGIFVRVIDQISNEDRLLFQSVARAILSDSRGTLAEQINRRDMVKERRNSFTAKVAPVTEQINRPEPSEERRRFFPFNNATADELTSPPNLVEPRVPRLRPINVEPKDWVNTDKLLPRRDLILTNGIGGFTPDGREYVITTSSDQVTPAPWVNVLANPQFGTVVSESGQAYTWGENAHEFRLTPWANDPVSDLGGEVFYLRDEESGRYWSPTPLPCRGTGDYVTRHGFGYSVFEHSEDGLVSELTVYVALDASIKYSVLRVRNDTDRTRQLSATGYVEWVLGDLRPKSVMHIHTETDPATNALFARNPYNTEFTRRTAFFDVDSSTRSFSGDRNEFIGRNRSLHNPAAMEQIRLSGKVGASLDPCAAMQVQFELGQGQQKELVFMLGVADTRRTDVSQLVQRYRGVTAAQEALAAVHAYWQQTLGAVQVETPDPAFDVLANGWLMYQTIACRLWARSGYYQSGGAFGFRDQLQDTMALVHSEPKLVREHLLLSAAHQFIEGDAQHWWHPPTDRGVRTHCSDDFLWLPLAVHRYISCTGDSGILDETIHFIEGRALNQDEDSYYDLPILSPETATLYVHCVRAIERGLKFGVHGLSLIGSCDWNDGMDKVGQHGKGESIWLSFFLYEVLMRFSEVAAMKNDTPFKERCHQEATTLQQNIESNGWDGNWYRRAYFDDGTPLGSDQNIECQIDSISQSWSILSGAGDRARSKMAMQAVDRRLVRRDDAIIQLLDPPFNKSDQNPGYIRGYVPGVRENGGQYTHAAIWTAMAFAKMGTNGELADRERAWELMRMINPVNHGNSAATIAKYKVEPYVIAADVYAVAPHVGRGGWTWYTGSSGWMYRLMTESLLGLQLMGDKLRISPCLPRDWPTYQLHYRYRDTMYHIRVNQNSDTANSASITVDGVNQADGLIALIDDRQNHTVEIVVQV